MIVYSGTKKDFISDVFNGEIADKIQNLLRDKGYNHHNLSEYRSWDNSLREMLIVLHTNEIPEDVHVAIEYQIPATSKRVDFLISGYDDENNQNVVIIELKQWEQVERTDKEDLVMTFVGGAKRLVPHPSYQAYSYAKLIENFNAYVEDGNVKLKPCSFLHNFHDRYKDELINERYQEIINLSPVFLKKDAKKLQDFIIKYIKKSDQGRTLYEIDHGKIRPSKSLQDAIASMMTGNKEFEMIDEQKVAFETIKDLVEKSMESDQKHTIIIEGGPGTGKSVIAINLLAYFRDRTVSYVTKNNAPKAVYSAKLVQNNFKKSYIKNLFKGSGTFVDSRKNDFDLLLIDEAHRLNKKSGLFSNKGENQIKELIHASKISVFFIDEDQIVTIKDFGSIEEIKKQARKQGSIIHYGEDLKLTSQFRCNGSEGYLAFLDDLLEIRETANKDGFDLDYDIKVYDSPSKMREDLREKNKINNKSRMLAGYTYDWISKKDISKYDIHLEDGFIAQWNFSNTETWAIDEESFDQVGCIHTSQGLEFDYVGVIIGKDLYYEDGKVKTDFTKRASTDKSLHGVKKYEKYDLADRIIRNTYKTLLTRGQKGCYIYCEDKSLATYIKKRISNLRKDY